MGNFTTTGWAAVVWCLCFCISCGGDAGGGGSDASAALDGAPNDQTCSETSACFVAVADFGIVARSPDGVAWHISAPFALSSYRALASDDTNRLVAVGDAGAVTYSVNRGHTWTQAAAPPCADVQLKDVAYGDGLWVTVGAPLGTGGFVFFTSDDGGDTWTKAVAPDTAPALAEAVAFGEGRWIAVGSSGVALSSIDGLVWQQIDVGTSHWLFDVAYDGNRFFVVGEQGEIRHSEFGDVWIEDPPNITSSFERISTGDYPSVIILGRDPTTLLMPSEGGAIWWPVAVPTSEELGAIVYGADRWIALGDYTPFEQNVFYSDSVGQTWLPSTADANFIRPADAVFLP